MNKLAVASLAAIVTANQLFLEMGPNGVPIAYNQVPQQPLEVSNELFANGSKQKIIGYYTDWSTYARNYQPMDIPYDKVDYINFAFANIQGGKVVMGDSYADSDKAFPGDCWNPGCKRGIFNQFAKAKIAHPHLKTMISIGGWTWSGQFSDVAATEQSRQTFCESAVEFALEHGFDGIDIDWEYPVEGGLTTNHHRPEDKVNYTAVIAKLRELLDAQTAKDGKRYEISIASTANYAFLQNYEWDKLSQSLSWINIMSYDFHGPFKGALDQVTGHNAALKQNPNEPEVTMAVADFNVEAAVNLFLQNGVPKSKINVGLAFYGRGYGGVAKGDENGLFSTYAGPAGLGTWEKGSFDFWDLEANYINKNGYTKHVDSLAGVPYLYSEAAQNFISYDDETSITLKTQFIQQEGFGGAMFWEFSGDKHATLLNTVYNTLGSNQ